jgi:hypothetical protein
MKAGMLNDTQSDLLIGAAISKNPFTPILHIANIAFAM